ncbi:hypothetical protein WJX72_003796 [[Myrmecia] bisecta]|uniref:NAD(P)-binding protein n=1 Tax=[Myrmecia] bisecta TaxID=41462 RepID=A0AAW1Q707_9CHLO
MTVDFSEVAEKYDLAVKTCIVTGGNSGLGFQIAKALVVTGARVIIAVRSEENGHKTVQELEQVIGRSRSKGSVEYIHLDLASFRSIHEFAATFLKRGYPLHVLVNNAAVWVTTDQKTEEGFENQLGTHYFGHVLLTELLLHKLKDSQPSRLVWVTSAAEAYGEVDWNDLEGKSKASDFKTYSTTKLYGLMAARELAHRLDGSGVHVFAGQPGMSSTNFFNKKKFDMGKLSAVVQWIAQKFIGLTPEEGATPIIHAALAPVDEVVDTKDGVSYGPWYKKTPMGGLPYISNSKDLLHHQGPENPDAQSDEACSRLYTETLRIIKSKASSDPTKVAEE